MENELRFAVVEIHMSPWEAHVSRALLESEGVPAFLAGEHHVGANWPMSLVLGGVRLLVQAEDLAKARSVLQARDGGELQAALLGQVGECVVACARCGATEFTESNNRFSVALSCALLFFCRGIFPPAKKRTCKSCGGLVSGRP